MRVFLYGYLLSPATLAARGGDPGLPMRCRPAVLRGWRRVGLARTPWPTLRRDPKGGVAGQVVNAGAAAVRRLTAYEGQPYRLRRVVVDMANRPVPAWTWIAPGGTWLPWT